MFNNYEINKINDTVYLISNEWFGIWKNHHKTIENSINDSKNTEIEILPSINENKSFFYINSDFLDPDIENDYTNYIISKEKEENKDFIIVNKETWNFLFSLYGGIEIKRFSLDNFKIEYILMEVFNIFYHLLL